LASYYYPPQFFQNRIGKDEIQEHIEDSVSYTRNQRRTVLDIDVEPITLGERGENGPHIRLVYSHLDAADKTLICHIVVLEPRVKAYLMRIEVAQTGRRAGLEYRPAAVNIL
jgi:hypothetical protein